MLVMKRALFLAAPILALTAVIVSCWGQSQREANNIAVSKIEEFRKANGRLPDSFSEAGARDDESCPCYCKTGHDSYLVWYGTALGESDMYDSETKKWSPGNRACVARVSEKVDEHSGPVISQENAKKVVCGCAEQLQESQISKQVEHIEMGADVMGNHVNVKGVALMEVSIDKDGHVLCV
jgi:hypothetical protein